MPDQMHTEWTAWTDGVVHEFNALGIDINESKYDPLARAIELWGEELAQLRSVQDDSISLTALMEKRDRYRKTKAPSA